MGAVAGSNGAVFVDEDRERRKIENNGGAQPARDVPHPRRGKPRRIITAPTLGELPQRRKLLAAVQRQRKAASPMALFRAKLA